MAAERFLAMRAAVEHGEGDFAPLQIVLIDELLSGGLSVGDVRGQHTRRSERRSDPCG